MIITYQFSIFTLMVNVAATTPSIIDSAKGSNRLSSLLMKSGFKMQPQWLLYSNIPRFNCMARSAIDTKTSCLILHFILIQQNIIYKAKNLFIYILLFSKLLMPLFCGTIFLNRSSFKYIHVYRHKYCTLLVRGPTVF